MPEHRVAEIGEQRAAETEQQGADVAKQLVRRRGRPSAECPRRDLKKKIELFIEEAERHDDDGGPNPGQIGPLVRRMIGKPVDQSRAAEGRSVPPAAVSAGIVIL